MRRVEGVRDASFSFVEGTGWVTYDPENTDPTEFIAELESVTDFSARVGEEQGLDLGPGGNP